MIGQQGLPSLGKAPYYIVVAEQKGVPESADRSLAHCLENMWLKATAIGLGFQLLSITERMAEDKEFCNLIDIPFGEYALDGCLIGYPDAPPAQSKRPQLGEVTRWL
jgi:nitroreductase